MEGIGSRLGRASSRYGPAPVFTGPVRRWQKQWVQVSSSSSSSSSSSVSNNLNSKGKNNNVSSVRLRRWTPIPPPQSGGDSGDVTEERPRRKQRYTPIVVLEEKKKESEQIEVEFGASKTNHSIAQDTLENDDNEKQSFGNVFAAETQASNKHGAAIKDLNRSTMDLDSGNHDSDAADKEADWITAARRTGFAR